MKTNLTLRYLEDGAIELFEQKMPAPGPGEVQLSGGFCGICSWDIVTAKLGKDAPVMAPPGHEGMATVAAVGKGVTGFDIGQKVACGPDSAEPYAGAFSTCRNVPARFLYPLPEAGIEDLHWLVEPVSCIVTGLDHSAIKVSDRIVVLGCGFMGLLFLQALLKTYVAEIIAIDISDKRLHAARSLGVKETYDLNEGGEALTQELYARGIDTVIDTTGAAEGFNAACEIVKVNGLVNHFGWVKSAAASVNLSHVHFKSIQIASTPPAAQKRDPFPPAIEAIANRVFDLKPLVTHTASLSDYPSLMNRIIAGDPDYIKGVIRLEA